MYSYYNSNYNRYNYRRNRYSYDNYWYDLLYEYYFGRRRRNRGGDGGNTPDKPEPPKEEKAKVLEVKDVDVDFDGNTLRHRTDQYDCTKDRKTDDGKEKPAQLVLRRGDFFYTTIKFDRPYEDKKHDMKLLFQYGDDPNRKRGTQAEFELDETGKKTFKPNEWGASIVSRSGNSIKIKVHVPVNVHIGEWDLTVKSYCKGKNKEGKDVMLSFSYDDISDIIILFNPWCKADPCYMNNEKLLLEYVLNESGCVYQGSGWNVHAKAWDFAQFEDGILDVVLDILKSAFRRPDSMSLSDPVQVARALAWKKLGISSRPRAKGYKTSESEYETIIKYRIGQMLENDLELKHCWDRLFANASEVTLKSVKVNDCLLAGNWSGDYKGGTEPWVWKGSKKILKKFMETKLPVKYGQCWVFSALLVTLCRALGIPCRSVTNFQSAHDTEKTCTIDNVVDAEGNDISKDYTGDSVWNFHVWNEVWFARHDITHLSGMDGWQALDSTPQEISDGLSKSEDPFHGTNTCGPCPIATLKKGRCDTKYDADFIFAEVNADRIYWQVSDDGQLSVLKTEPKAVGEMVLTKKPNGEPYPPESYDAENNRFADLTWENCLNVTHTYKHTEGSEEERAAVLMAHKTARNPIPEAYDAPQYKKDVVFKIMHSNKVMIGQDLLIELSAHNTSKLDRTIEKMNLMISPKDYTGYHGPIFYKEEIKEIKLNAGKEATWKINLTQDKYLPHLMEKGNLAIECFALVQKTDTEEEQRTMKTREFTFGKPGLSIKGPRVIKFGETVEYNIKFTNPLNIPLTKCVLSGECIGFKDEAELDLPDIPPNGKIDRNLTFKVKDTLKKTRHPIIFELDSKELLDITDAKTVAFTK